MQKYPIISEIFEEMYFQWSQDFDPLHFKRYVYVCWDIFPHIFTYLHISSHIITYLNVPTGMTYPENQARDWFSAYVTPLLCSWLTTWCVVERLDIIVQFAGVRCSWPGINFVHSSSNLPVRGSKLDIWFYDCGKVLGSTASVTPTVWLRTMLLTVFVWCKRLLTDTAAI